MRVEYALNKIDEIVLGIKKQSKEERLTSYTLIVAILSRLEEIAKDNKVPNFKVYATELLWSLEILCDLDDGNAYDSQHISWALGAIEKLQSESCFNIR